MPTYWFRSISSGEKVTATSLQAINRLAQREADKFGQGVQVHSESGRKSHRRMSAARNPAKRKTVKGKGGKMPISAAQVDAVHAKIGQLIMEGYPQNQAVAIALSEFRRVARR